MRETLRHREAFEFYYTSGEKRNLALVAQHCGVNLRAVKKWSVAFGWQERLEERDAEVARRLKEKLTEDMVQLKFNYHRIIEAAIARWVQKFKARQADPKTVSDLIHLIKLDLLLLGELPSDQPELLDNDWQERLLTRLNHLAARSASAQGTKVRMLHPVEEAQSLPSDRQGAGRQHCACDGKIRQGVYYEGA